jgi:hypothetical protein
LKLYWLWSSTVSNLAASSSISKVGLLSFVFDSKTNPIFCNCFENLRCIVSFSRVEWG